MDTDDMEVKMEELYQPPPWEEPDERFNPLAAAQVKITALEKQAEEFPLAMEQAVLDYAITSAVACSDTVDPELLTMLLRQAGLTVENGAVPGLQEALDRQRSERPWLFRDGGSRPHFAAETAPRAPDRDTAPVRERYRGNPWYRRGKG